MRSREHTFHLPVEIPVFPLSGALLLPRGRLPLQIFEPRYLAMVDDAMRSQRMIGMVQPQGSNANPGNGSTPPNLYPVGCLGRITSWSETGDGRLLITLTGVIRFRINAELAANTPYRRVHADYSEFMGDLVACTDEDCVDRARLGAGLRNFFRQKDMENYWPSMEQVPGEVLINSLSMICPFETAEKQALLEAPALADRARLLTALIEMTAAADANSGGTLQ